MNLDDMKSLMNKRVMTVEARKEDLMRRMNIYYQNLQTTFVTKKKQNDNDDIVLVKFFSINKGKQLAQDLISHI